MGSVRHSSQYNFSWIHCHGNGRRALPPLPRATDGLASAEYARQAEQTRRLPRRRCLPSQSSKLIHDGCGPEDRYVQLELISPIWYQTWVARHGSGARGLGFVLKPNSLPQMSNADFETGVDGGHASW